MMRPLLASTTLLILSLAPLGSAFADEPLQGGEVVILQFDTMNVDEPVMDLFYSQLHRTVDAQRDLTLGEGGDVSMADFLLVAGCGTPDEECLSMVSDFVDGDLLLFGSVQAAEDVHMFSLHLFDFRTNSFVRQISDQTLRGDFTWLEEGIPAVIDHFMYGPTATVNVQIVGSDEADIRINGLDVGSGSQRVENLPPGEMVVVVRTKEGEEEIQRAIVGHDEEITLEFQFGSERLVVEAADVGSQRDRPALIPGFVVTSLGVAGLVVGVMGNSRLTAAESEANSLVGGRPALDRAQIEYAQELDARMDDAHTLRVIGLSVGAVGIAAGSALLIRALSDENFNDMTSSTAGNLRFDISPGADGIRAGIRINF